MRILVTADIHLSADNPEREAAVADVVRIAEEEDVEYLLIAGDMFDAGVDVEAMKTRIRPLFSENDFQTYVIPGNHDANAFRKEDYFGDDIEVLSSSPFEQVDLGTVNLLAVPYVEEDFGELVDGLDDARDDERLNVLLLHGTLSTATGQVFGEESRYLPFTAEQLLATGIEYVFAGHIHSSPTKRTFGPGNCVFAYPGSPVSITTKETNRRGVWVFDTDTETLQKRDVDSFHYVRETLDLSPGTAEVELERLASRLSAQQLEHATVLIEPSGFITLAEREFFDRLTEIAEDAGADSYEIDRSGVESARAILDTRLYQDFESKLAEKENVDQQAVQNIVLRALSVEER